MQGQGRKNESALAYIVSILQYYFAPKPRSVFTLLYFLFFSYFVIFYLDNIFLAVRFLIGTIFSSTVSLSPDYLIWGSIFIVNLVLPFATSVAAIIIPYEMRRKAWPRITRILLALVGGFLLVNFILLFDFSISFVERQIPIKTFLESKGIPLKN